MFRLELTSGCFVTALLAHGRSGDSSLILKKLLHLVPVDLSLPTRTSTEERVFSCYYSLLPTIRIRFIINVVHEKALD